MFYSKNGKKVCDCIVQFLVASEKSTAKSAEFTELDVYVRCLGEHTEQSIYTGRIQCKVLTTLPITISAFLVKLTGF